MWGKRREAEVNDTADAAPAAAAVNGAAVKTEAARSLKAQAPASAPEAITQAFWRSKLMTANFSGAASQFMRSPAHRHYTLADLEWRLVPLALNQFAWRVRSRGEIA